MIQAELAGEVRIALWQRRLGRYPATHLWRDVSISNLDPERWTQWWDESGERELRQILFWRWDPINVADEFPFPESEYDEHAVRLASLLRDGASPEAIEYHLWSEEREGWQLKDGRARKHTRQDVARYIWKWYPRSIERWLAFGSAQR